jgi:hypothetical protein
MISVCERAHDGPKKEPDRQDGTAPPCGRAPGSGARLAPCGFGVSPAVMERGVRRSAGGAHAASFAKTRQRCAALDSEFGAYSPRAWV